MTSYVAYIFAYVPKRPVNGTWPASMLRQHELIKAFEMRHDCKSLGTRFAYQTNRQKHFANVPEFQMAVKFALENKAWLIVGDLQGLLSALHPDQIVSALKALSNAGVTLVDATSYQAFDQKVGVKMGYAASVVGRNRRRPIKMGLEASKIVRLPSSANQAKATQGTMRSANIRAVRLLPDIDSIIAGQPVGMVLTATVLASELNRRSVLAAQGGSWSISSAWHLIKRLSALDPAKSWTST